MRYAIWSMGAIALALSAPMLGAQERPPRRQEPIEIRGTVPTPQVVTVRPRETPAYSRKVLVPNFYDHDFWPSILPAYRLVAERMVSGQSPTDTALLADTLGLLRDTLGMQRDSLGRLVPPPAARIDTMPLRPDSARTLPPAQTTPPPVTPPPPGEDRTLSDALGCARETGTASAFSTPRKQSMTRTWRRV